MNESSKRSRWVCTVEAVFFAINVFMALHIRVLGEKYNITSAANSRATGAKV